MKHHYADLLDRKSGHWTMVANADRHIYRIGDFKAAQKSVSIVTMSKDDQNWELIGSLPNLTELTLHEPSKEQLEFVSTLWRLKRLRITHARPKSIEFIARLQAIEELVLEYVSGFDDLAPIGALENLRALHIENLRRVSDFSGLSAAKALKYLYISGTLDWYQPVEDFEFLRGLETLEIFKLGRVKSMAATPALRALIHLKHLKKIHIPTNLFPIEEYAFLELALPELEGAIFDPCKKWVPYMPMPEDDFRSKVSNSVIREKHPEVRIWSDGSRRVPDPAKSEYWFIGKGTRPIKCNSPKAQIRCAANKTKYEEAKIVAKSWLP